MKKKELQKLKKEQLINKCISLHATYIKLHSSYTSLKGDLKVIKGALTNIADNIYIKDGRGNSKMYFRGGKARKDK